MHIYNVSCLHIQRQLAFRAAEFDAALSYEAVSRSWIETQLHELSMTLLGGSRFTSVR
jgi:hypothetical protein